MSDPRAVATGRPDVHSFDGHVLGRIGMHAVGPDDPCGTGLHLHLSPMLLEPDGHIDFGVLGVFLDMASSQSGMLRPLVHADISVQRIAKPTGQKLLVDVQVLRAGKRTAIVQIEAFDEVGVRVADSTQQIVFQGESPVDSLSDDDRADHRRRFFEQFDGVCSLEEPLHDLIGLSEGVAEDGSAFWTMPLGPSTMNGFGGLHGGVAFDLVVEAAVGGSTRHIGSRTEPKGAMLRYLARATAGPFRAVPTVMPEDDGAVFARVYVYDDGNEGLLCIVGEVQLAVAR